MTRYKHAVFGSMLLASIVVPGGIVARAEEPVTLSITIKDHQFEPAEVHAPAGKPLSIAVKNLNSIAAEFESDSLHVEKVIRRAAKRSCMCGRSSRAATISSMIFIARRKVSWSCHEIFHVP